MTRNFPGLLIEIDDGVATVTLDREETLNAFDDDLHRSVEDVWRVLGENGDVRSILLTGAGRAFSAGGDIPEFTRMREDPAHRARSLAGAMRIAGEMSALAKPVVAAVNGPAVGLGASLAGFCDIVVMSERAYLCDPHVSVGLVAGDGTAAAWPLMAGLMRAKELILLGERIYAAEAVSCGLATRAVPAEQLMEVAAALAARLAAQPPQALQETKRALNLHLQQSIRAVLPFALMAESASFDTPAVARTIARFADGKS